MITLIAAIVVIALTGSAMLYFFSTSSYGELFVNRQERAYYLAESGANYVLQQFVLNKTTNGPFPATTEFTVGNDKFIVRTYDKPGDPAHLIIKSIGVAGSGWLTTRQLVTKDIIKDAATAPGIPPVTIDPVTGKPLSFDSNNNGALDTIWTPTAGTDAKIVNTGPSGGPALQFKGDSNEIDLNPAIIYLTSAWESNGGLLSYFIQVKINIDSQGNKGDHYLLGLTFRKIDNNNFYGFSFYRSENLSKLPAWCTSAFTSVIPNNGQVYAVFWKYSGGTRSVLAYTVMDYATYGVVTSATNQTLASWSTLIIRVNERFDGPGGACRNHLTAYVVGPSNYPLGTLSWNLNSYKQITWTAVQGLNPSQSAPQQEIMEDSFTSAGFTVTRQEIGVHAFYDSNSANEQFFNDFSTAIEGMGSGGSQY
ncbi:MAG: hypothetical protein ABFD66_05150 [Smithella sp.]